MMDEADHSEFQAFLTGLKAQAVECHVQPRVFDALIQGIGPLPEVLVKQLGQAEFTLSLRDYLARVLPDSRIRKGRVMVGKWRDLLNQIEATHGVEAEFITAIWGVESDFGRQPGETPTLPALATLAWKGRRGGFFAGELIAAMKIVQNLQARPDQMRGSWAGAMGHGQFMPSSYLEYAVDHDGDRRADIWDDNPTDSLASIANYLAGNGWQKGQPWGLEVHPPEGFDYGLTGLDQPRPLADWTALGVTLSDGALPADYGPASVVLPAGIAGPAFMVFQNFHVLMRYNNAMAYALAVGLLADRIANRSARLDTWPDEPPLSCEEVQELQAALNAAGHGAGAADGLMGPDTTTAIRTYQAANDLPADGYPDLMLLRHLKARQAPQG